MTAGRNESQPHDLEGLDDEELVVIGGPDDASGDEPEETVVIGGESRVSVEGSDVAADAGDDDADASAQRKRASDDRPPFQGMRIIIIVIMVIVFVFSVLYFLDYYGIVSMPFLRTLTIA